MLGERRQSMKYILENEVVGVGSNADVVTVLGPEHQARLDLNATHQLLCLPVVEGKAGGAGPATQEVSTIYT